MNNKYVALYILFFFSPSYYLHASTSKPGTKTSSPKEVSKTKGTETTTLSSKVSSAMKALYDAPGKLSEALGGSKYLISRNNNLSSSQASSSPMNAKEVSLGEAGSSIPQAPTVQENTGIDLSSISQASKPTAPPKPSVSSPTNSSPVPAQRSTVSEPIIKSSPRKKSPSLTTTQPKLNKRNQPAEKTIMTIIDPVTKSKVIRIIEKDGKSFREYKDGSKTPFRNVLYDSDGTSSTIFYNKQGEVISVHKKDSSGDLISITTIDKENNKIIYTQFTNNKLTKRLTLNMNQKIKGVELFMPDGTYKTTTTQGKVMETGSYKIDADYNITLNPKESTASTTTQNHKPEKISEAFKFLGLPENATKQQVKAAYKKMAKENHPDTQVGKSEEVKIVAAEKFIEIQKNYGILTAKFAKDAPVYNMES